MSHSNPSNVKFVCADCEKCFLSGNYHRFPEGKICDDCLSERRRQNRIRLEKISAGNRLRLMMGFPMLPELPKKEK